MPSARPDECNGDFSPTDQPGGSIDGKVSSSLVCSRAFLGRLCSRRDGDWCHYGVARFSAEKERSAKTPQECTAWIVWILGRIYWLHIYAVAPKHRGKAARRWWFGRDNHEQISAPGARRNRHCNHPAATARTVSLEKAQRGIADVIADVTRRLRSKPFNERYGDISPVIGLWHSSHGLKSGYAYQGKAGDGLSFADSIADRLAATGDRSGQPS